MFYVKTAPNGSFTLIDQLLCQDQSPSQMRSCRVTIVLASGVFHRNKFQIALNRATL